MSKDSQPSGTTTTTATSAPWGPQQPFLERGLQRAEDLYNRGPMKYPDQTLAAIDPRQTQAIELQAGRALSGSPVTSAANTNAAATLNGSFLDPSSNPYLSATYDQAAGKVRAGLDAQFSGAGRYGSGAHQAASGDALANLATQLYGGNYNAERTNQLRALALAPQTAQQDYTDIGQLAAAGDAAQGQQQNIINDQVNRFNFNQQAPYNQFAAYQQGVQGNYGGSQTTSQPYFNNSTANFLGAGLGAANVLGQSGAFGARGGGGFSTGWLSSLLPSNW